MNKFVLILMAGILLVGVNVYAQGNLIVNGKLDVGSGAPNSKIAVLHDNTDGTLTKASDFRINHERDSSDNLSGAFYNVQLRYSQSMGTITSVIGQDNAIGFRQTDGNYTDISSLYGARYLITDAGGSAHTYTIGDVKGIEVGFTGGAGTGTWNVTNAFGAYITDSGLLNTGGTTFTAATAAGMWIDQQTVGTNKYGLVLNGSGAGADVVFGAAQEARIYFDGSEIHVVDAASNDTIISPHDTETGEWIFYSKNTKTGRTVRVNMEKLVQAVEKLTGETFMVESLGDVK